MSKFRSFVEFLERHPQVLNRVRPKSLRWILKGAASRVWEGNLEELSDVRLADVTAGTVSPDKYDWVYVEGNVNARLDNHHNPFFTLGPFVGSPFAYLGIVTFVYDRNTPVGECEGSKLVEYRAPIIIRGSDPPGFSDYRSFHLRALGHVQPFRSARPWLEELLHFSGYDHNLEMGLLMARKNTDLLFRVGYLDVSPPLREVTDRGAAVEKLVAEMSNL